ncbi:hypothetical protein AMELA_G00019490 [Ameiurus melas]|uniref:Uncharacterized protein n=1 Tax=Ameiurus melas TaxID=219545 RepID=A0A7J6BB95_AMEME|nr:hypothetical protein AMELA_G00019490 [Ameiurus melas]
MIPFQWTGGQEPRQPPKTTRLRFHRGNVFNELNAAFKNVCVFVDESLLEIEMVLLSGNTEKGEDNGGVLRDALSADLLVAQNIQVQFMEPENMFTRTPQAHTCGCVLEVPNNYASYPELAEEFINALDANMWVMDII